ncbi:MAG: hypothetical protein RR290_02650 [Clostridia bacterium]
MSFSKVGADNLSRILSMVLSYEYKGIENELNVQTIPEIEYLRTDKMCKIKEIIY